MVLSFIVSYRLQAFFAKFLLGIKEIFSHQLSLSAPKFWIFPKTKSPEGCSLKVYWDLLSRSFCLKSPFLSTLVEVASCLLKIPAPPLQCRIPMGSGCPTKTYSFQVTLPSVSRRGLTAHQWDVNRGYRILFCPKVVRKRVCLLHYFFFHSSA